MSGQRSVWNRAGRMSGGDRKFVFHLPRLDKHDLEVIEMAQEFRKLSDNHSILLSEIIAKARKDEIIEGSDEDVKAFEDFCRSLT